MSQERFELTSLSSSSSSNLDRLAMAGGGEEGGVLSSSSSTKVGQPYRSLSGDAENHCKRIAVVHCTRGMIIAMEQAKHTPFARWRHFDESCLCAKLGVLES